MYEQDILFLFLFLFLHIFIIGYVCLFFSTLQFFHSHDRISIYGIDPLKINVLKINVRNRVIWFVCFSNSSSLSSPVLQRVPIKEYGNYWTLQMWQIAELSSCTTKTWRWTQSLMTKIRGRFFGFFHSCFIWQCFNHRYEQCFFLETLAHFKNVRWKYFNWSFVVPMKILEVNGTERSWSAACLRYLRPFSFMLGRRTGVLHNAWVSISTSINIWSPPASLSWLALIHHAALGIQCTCRQLAHVESYLFV